MGKAGMEQAATELLEVQALKHTLVWFGLVFVLFFFTEAHENTPKITKTAELQYYERQAD